MPRRLTLLLAAPLALAALPILAVPGSAAPPAPAQLRPQQTAGPGSIVSAVPADWTPDVLPLNGLDVQVQAVTQVGDDIIVGGNFNQGIQYRGTGQVINQNWIFALNEATQQYDAAFQPTLNNQVQALLPGPAPGEVYVGGNFSQVTAGGKTKPTGHLALLNVSNGTPVAGFNPPKFNGAVDALAMADGQLFVGGTYSATATNGTAAGGIVSLNPTTGALTSYLNPDPTSGLGVSGHHNYDVNCTSSSPHGCADGAVGIAGLAVSPNGTRLVEIGNFNHVGGSARDQAAMLDLSNNGASLDPFDTGLYHPACNYWGFDSYIRDVAFSPDGSYFAIAATGGGGVPQPNVEGCDSVARFNVNSTGAPAWVDYSGVDTISAVVISNTAVYIGGHNRWVNNANANNVPGPGAIPAAGLAALDPRTGLPYAWTPGRDPRGIAVYAMFIDSSGGLWVGSDTDYIGPRVYLRAKLAYFPAAGGKTIPAETLPALPGGVYIGGQNGGNSLLNRSLNPAARPVAGATSHAATGAVDWAETHGAFLISGNLYFLYDHGGASGLYRVSFDGTPRGAPVYLTPWENPEWDGVQTGSGQTYTGRPPPLYGETTSVTGMFYSDGEIYYTLTGDSALHRVAFQPESGVVGATSWIAPSSGVSFNGARGLFAYGGQIYWVDGAGHLYSASFRGGVVSGPIRLVDSRHNWSGQAVFLGSSVPRILTPPATHVALSGTTVVFSVVTSGAPTPRIQWQRALRGGHYQNLPGAHASRLALIARRAVNGARYRAVVSNTFGRAISRAATLLVRTPTLSVTPGTARVNGVVTVRVRNYLLRQPVSVHLNSAAGPSLTAGTSGAHGGYTARFRMPPAAYGLHRVVVVDAARQTVARTLLDVRPTVGLSPATGRRGSLLMVHLEGMAGRHTVVLRLGSRFGRLFARLTTSPDGAGAKSVRIPAGLRAGRYVVFAICRGVPVVTTALRVT